MAGEEVRVLGPLEVVASDGVVVHLAAKQKRLLAALVAADGRACNVDDLVEAVWERFPASFRPEPGAGVRLAAAQGVARRDGSRHARRRVRAESSSLAASTRRGSSGCSPSVRRPDAIAMPLLRRRSPTRRWRSGTAARTGSWRTRSSCARRASGWRSGSWPQLEARLDAQLALGRHVDVLGEALALADQNPSHERVQELALLALYRCGRQTEALDHYAAVRARLREELGLEPGRELRELQRRILQQDPELSVESDRHDRGRGGSASAAESARGS